MHMLFIQDTKFSTNKKKIVLCTHAESRIRQREMNSITVTYRQRMFQTNTRGMWAKKRDGGILEEEMPPLKTGEQNYVRNCLLCLHQPISPFPP